MKTNMDVDRKKLKWLVLLCVFLIIAIVSAIIMTVQTYREYRAKKEYESLAAMVNQTTEAANQTETEKDVHGTVSPTEPTTENILEKLGIEIPRKNLDWDALHSITNDIYAWIYVPGTDVDYPVLQHPDNNEYYLRYNLDGSKGHPGCIYTELYNSKDFSDINTVLYGHTLTELDMDSMFTSLHNFEDKDFFAEDNYIYIYTQDYVFVYQVFAAYEFSAYHLLLNYDLTNEYVYEDYLRRIYEANGRVANVRKDITVGTDDKIITLSTCTLDFDFSLRYLIAGVLINPRD